MSRLALCASRLLGKMEELPFRREVQRLVLYSNGGHRCVFALQKQIRR